MYLYIKRSARAMDLRIKWNYLFLVRHAMVGLLILHLLATVSAQVTQLPASATGSHGGAGSASNGSLPTSLPSLSKPTPSLSPTNASSSSSNSTAAPPTDNNSSSSAISATHATSVSVTDAITASLPLTTVIENTATSSGNQSSSFSSSSPSPSSSSPPSVINTKSPSITDETDMATSMTTPGSMNTDMNGMMTTTIDGLVTYELLTTDEYPTGFGDDTITEEAGGIFTESLIRLLIIAGATAGSCIVLLTVIFLVVFCYHRRQRRKRNSRYYEFKKKDFKSKYERVEMKNSLARKDQPENTPIGGGWVFSSGNYHHDYDDDDLPRAGGVSAGTGLRNVSPIAVATPLLKVPSITATASTGLDDIYHDSNGVPDSGHGGSIPPDDSALGFPPDDSATFGFSPSLEHDIELELSPLYRAMGATSTITGGSEARDHSYIGGGDSDTISNGNESLLVDSGPIREVLFDSFGGSSGRASTARDEQVEL